MATKQELLDEINEAGVRGFSMGNTRGELADAVANIKAEANAHAYARRQTPGQERYDNPRNRAHASPGGGH